MLITQKATKEAKIRIFLKATKNNESDLDDEDIALTAETSRKT